MTAVQHILQTNNALPITYSSANLPQICSNCRYVNHESYRHCTNCGYPLLYDVELVKKFQYRDMQRMEQRNDCLRKVRNARKILYGLAAISLLGISYLFSGYTPTQMKGLLMVVMGAVYAGLGKWSEQKPFTSLLIGLIMLLTFTALNTWKQLTSLYVSPGSMYIFIIQVVLAAVIFRGVRSAFCADILEEELKV